MKFKPGDTLKYSEAYPKWLIINIEKGDYLMLCLETPIEYNRCKLWKFTRSGIEDFYYKCS